MELLMIPRNTHLTIAVGLGISEREVQRFDRTAVAMAIIATRDNRIFNDACRTYRQIEYSNIGSSPITPYLGHKVQFYRRFATEEVSRKPIMVLEEVSGSVEYPFMTGNVG
ncbi:hypothetical protein G5I_13464 [Acromyrmex echinatior]|uniref:Uncharacterized protein n=1 Tax=Acromyrmex echinatior TaxID=103372 RepID=F4X553_ACREC|nr:hypothetical protein G5I_13464 [Acromyrmex echinatior]